jgi:hypothetical protein
MIHLGRMTYCIRRFGISYLIPHQIRRGAKGAILATGVD